MSRASWDDRWSYNGLRAIVLENQKLRLVVLPETGGKLHSLEDRTRQREWLWRNPRIAPARADIGSAFDNHWSGGADVFFPTCYPCTWEGLAIPDSGEWWSVPWQATCQEDADGVTLTLAAGGRVYPVEATRTFTLGHGDRHLRLGFRVRNVGHEPLPFLLGFHPALELRAGGRIHLPEGTAQVDESSGGSMGEVGQRYPWPNLPHGEGHSADMGIVRPSSAGQFGGHFLFPDREGDGVHWAVTDPEGGAGLALAASRQFRGLWLWQVYGGWRGYHHVALEPWTSHPITLAEAVAKGTADWIAPGETYSAEITLSCFDGLRDVAAVTLDGRVQGVPMESAD